VEETGVPGENHRQTLSHNVVPGTPRHERDFQCCWYLFCLTYDFWKYVINIFSRCRQLLQCMINTYHDFWKQMLTTNRGSSLSCYIDGVMFSVLALNVVDRVFELWSGQTKDYTICISWFSAKYAAFRRKSKHWLARNQDNGVSDCCLALTKQLYSYIMARTIFQWDMMRSALYLTSTLF
jgi:hypothetical protein